MRSFRFHPSIWLLAAALSLAATTSSLAQALSAEDTALLDAVALLYLGDEEGRQVYRRSCLDEYDWRMVLEGMNDSEWRIKRAKTAPEVVRKHCPGRAN